MSFFQRLLSGVYEKEKQSKEHLQVEVQTIEADQPFNPYTELHLLQNHTDIIRILLQIDNKRCVTAADDNKAIIWNIVLGYHLAVLSGHTHPITSIVLLPPRRNNSVQLLTGSSDKQIRRWDVETGECLQVISTHGTSVRCLTLVDIGHNSMFCSGGHELCLWSTDGKLLDRFQVRSTEEADICFIIPITNDRIVTAADKQMVVYSIASADLDGGMEEDENKSISLVKKLPSHREVIRCIINIRDGYFASGSIDGTIILWKTETLLPDRYFNSKTEYQGPDKMYPYSIQCLMTVDERYILAAVGAGFSLFDSVTGNLVLHKKVAHYSKILCLTFACEGMFLVTASEDGAIRLWGRKQVIQEAMQVDTLPERKPGILGTFLNLRNEDTIDLNPEVELDLVGECLAHSGAVQVLMNIEEGFMSGAADGLLIIWKSSQLQMVKRNRLIQGKQQQLEEDILGMHSDSIKRHNCPV
ncbi:hypothetical protein ACJMK2_044357 [Sinanodonta woodiana]|uniref:WD repeat-containing protein 41 n=1 Tax=Sinanodonta woodiana TaxID=1069815 RepID=A0ABD3W3G0_SINWO